MNGRTLALLRRLVDVREGELAALAWSSACGGLMLAAYYILRPLREEMGVAGGVKNLPWMFTGTLLATLAASPLFSLLVSRTSRRRFIPIAHHFFALNLLLFFLLFHVLSPKGSAYLARGFFIWTSVFNLFVVSIFWGYMADLFRSEQGKRLFGFISAGGTLGAVCGSFLTTSIVHAVGAVQLLLIAAVVLEIGVVALHRLESLSGSLSWSAAPAGAARSPRRSRSAGPSAVSPMSRAAVRISSGAPSRALTRRAMSAPVTAPSKLPAPMSRYTRLACVMVKISPSTSQNCSADIVATSPLQT